LLALFSLKLSINVIIFRVKHVGSRIKVFVTFVIFLAGKEPSLFNMRNKPHPNS
jgi:hypothetical protein